MKTGTESNGGRTDDERAEREGVAARRVRRIMQVCDEIHAESVCRRFAVALGEDPKAILLDAQGAMWSAWKEDFDEEDEPYKDVEGASGLTVHSWARTFLRYHLNEMVRQRRKGGMRRAPDDTSVALWDGDTDPTDGDHGIDPMTIMPLASLLSDGPDVDPDLIQRVASLVDPDHLYPPEEMYRRALDAAKLLVQDMACKANGGHQPTRAELDRAVDNRDPGLDPARRTQIIGSVRETSGILVLDGGPADTPAARPGRRRRRHPGRRPGR